MVESFAIIMMSGVVGGFTFVSVGSVAALFLLLTDSTRYCCRPTYIPGSNQVFDAQSESCSFMIVSSHEKSDS